MQTRFNTCHIRKVPPGIYEATVQPKVPPGIYEATVQPKVPSGIVPLGIYEAIVPFTSVLILNLFYDTSFLNRKKVVIDGDVESNPGPVASAQAHRTAVGSYYNTARILSNVPDLNYVTCSCHKYKDFVEFKMNCKDFNFCIVAIEFTSSFISLSLVFALKKIQNKILSPD